MRKTKEWIGIMGTRYSADGRVVRDGRIRKDVRNTLKKLLGNGYGIIIGSASGVSSMALAEAIQLGMAVQIYMPTSFEKWVDHLREMAEDEDEPLTPEQADEMIVNLSMARERTDKCKIVELNHKDCSEDACLDRDRKIVKDASEIFTFQVNNSPRVTQAIEFARKQSKPLKPVKYDHAA